jgi:hypothetical protein
MILCGMIADPHHIDKDLELAFYFDADPDPAFHVNVEPDSTFHFGADQVPPLC